VDGKLVTLARRLIDLDRKAADVRDEMRRLLANGGGPGPRPPTRRAVKPAKARPAAPEASAARLSPNAARIAQARVAEQRILKLLADGPKGPAQLARSTNAQISTIGERLRRLKAQGLVARGDQGWTLPISTS
jgi:predicted Rossmann fold nucleotide-binding protein DprA/Smf involved in DNA uptake